MDCDLWSTLEWNSRIFESINNLAVQTVQWHFILTLYFRHIVIDSSHLVLRDIDHISTELQNLSSQLSACE
jgi:hypothetical protein